MLTTTTPQLKAIKGAEKLSALKESTHRATERYRLSDQLELKDAGKRTGTQLFHTDLIGRIEKLTGRRVWAEDSRNDANVCGFYYLKGGMKTYICAFDKGPLPEYSIVTTDDRDLPIKEKRGWRTVLTRLMQAGVLTWPQVVYGFGAGDPNAERWNFNTRDARAK